MLNGLTITGVGTVNGSSLTGSQALRASTLTHAMIANGNLAGLAYYLNTTSLATGVNGGIFEHAGLPPAVLRRESAVRQRHLGRH
jgi:hypothetical protein